jgi:UDP-glucose 4-epimerase
VHETVLVTGGAGFVGRWLVNSLLADGLEIWLIDDLSTGVHPSRWLEPGAIRTGEADGVEWFRSASGRVAFVQADAVAFFGAQLRLPGFDRRLRDIRLPPFGQAFHLASVVGGRKKIEGQPLHVGIDLAIDSMFALWVAEAGLVERMLYASSSAAYPVELQTEHADVALEENAVDFANARISMPDLTYGWSKLTGEYLTHLLATVHGLPCCCVRPFSGYGEDQDLDYPVPAIARRAARRDDPLVVWGSGRQSRDFVHIADCVRAMRIAIERIEDGSAVNIGSGEQTDFLTVARILAELEGYAPEIRGTGAGPVGVHSRYASMSYARQRVGFEPEVTLREGLERVLRHQRSLHASETPAGGGVAGATKGTEL